MARLAARLPRRTERCMLDRDAAVRVAVAATRESDRYIFSTNVRALARNVLYAVVVSGEKREAVR